MKPSVKNMVLVAMLSAISYAIVFFVRIPVVLFLNYEPKDVIITIGAFLLGPWATVACSLVVSLLEMISISSTGPIGAVMNLLSTCCFSCTAAIVYKKKHTLHGAIAGLVAGSVAMVGAMLLWNWLITPLYMGVPRQDVQAMLVPVFLPFNALKAGLNTALTLVLYKPLVTALRRADLVAASGKTASRSKAGIYALGGVLLVSCVLLLLVFRGVI